MGFCRAAGRGRHGDGRGPGAKLERLRFSEPEDLSPLIADLFRDWYAGHGLPDSRLLVSSFLLMDPMLAMRTGSVPYWALFGTRPSLDRLAGYLSGAAAYDDIRLTIFPHGVESIGLPGIGEWQAVLGHARRRGELLAPPARTAIPAISGPSPVSTASSPGYPAYRRFRRSGGTLSGSTWPPTPAPATSRSDDSRVGSARAS